MPRAHRHRLLSTLHFLLLTGFLPYIFAERSSSQRSPPLEEAAELLRDAPLYPPLREDVSTNDNPELTEQSNSIVYDTETSIEESNIRVTPEESDSKFLNDASADTDDASNSKYSVDIDENSDTADIEDRIPFLRPVYPEDNLFKSSYLNNQDENDVFETSRDNDEDSEDISFFTSTKYDKFNENELRSIRETKEYRETENLNEADKVNEIVPDDDDLLAKKIIEENTNSEINLITLGKNKRDDPGILIAPDFSTNAKDSVLITSDEATVEDEDVGQSGPHVFDTTIETITDNTDDFNMEDLKTKQERTKRSQDFDKSTKTSRRVKTGDTILNIRGAVRDAIGDAGAAPGPRASTRLDAFVIRPAPAPRQPLRDEPRPDADEPAPKPVTSQKHERELLVAAHSYVRIPCDLVNVTNLRWYKDNEAALLSTALPGAEGAGAAGAGGDGALHIPRAAQAHTARWRCAGQDSKGRARAGRPTRLLVYEAVRSVYLAVDGRRLDAGNTWVPVRDTAVLEVQCFAEGGVPAPELSWRLLAQEPALDHRPYLRVYHTNHSVEGVRWSRAVVTAARELHNATLRCSALQRRPPLAAPRPPDAPPELPAQDDLSAQLQIHVTYPPSFVISRWPGFGARLVAGGAAALRCDVDSNPPARAHWMRDDDTTSSSPTPLEGVGEARGAATLRWPTLTEAHAGWYRCRASWLDTEYSSIGYYLNVLASEEPSQSQAQSGAGAEPGAGAEEPEHQKVDVPLGGNVQLHCPKGSVGCWWRRVVGNSSESWAPAGSHHAHGVLGIRGALYQEAGEYRCIGARGADMQRLRDLKRVTLRVTGAATATAVSATATPGGWRLECAACGRGVRVLWLRASPAPSAAPAHLAPHTAPHPAPPCYRAVLLLPEPDEVWCVAATSGGGAVAVFPRRGSPAPARHAQPGRAQHSAAHLASPHLSLLLLALLPLPPLLTLLPLLPPSAGAPYRHRFI
ncbi:uncharacterized protein LOC106711031 [Papilio machaon]|uniref:uncharacterized protein LOC106711031 n=1 Tax=Papilio machaon TaxID=76193 RepID=UPI001E664042|nr:uncharacterized protein LOC106711031 [Papilio machaon]